MDTILEKIQAMGIVPVVVLERAESAIPLAKALSNGGLPCAEITFRTQAAEESIRQMTEQFPNMLIGAGTVLTIEQADLAMKAGAKFIVSPGCNEKIIAHCIEKGVCIIPGCTNPSDVELALSYGLKVVKFFPAEAAGGLKMIKAMAAPYMGLKFMPTGGINENNLIEYLAYDRILACGGSWMVNNNLIKAGKFDEITTLVKKALMTMLGFELMHIGVNCINEQEADKTAEIFNTMFGFEKKIGTGSIFAGNVIEALKTPFLGKHGHIAIGTNSIFRAIHYLEGQGIKFNMNTAKYKNGTLTAIYMQEEIGGFAVHLLQK